MSVTIPFFNSLASFEEDVVLDGSSYKLLFEYNIRSDTWTLSVKNLEGTVLIAGIRVVLNFELLRSHPDRNLPPGALIPVDTTEDEERVNRDNLGVITQVVYLTEDEVDAI